MNKKANEDTAGKPVRINNLFPIGKDARGETFHVKNDRSGDFILAYRKAGSSSGRHYHQGISDYKNPEIMILLSGEVLIRWRKIIEKEIKEIKVTAPVSIEIDINIWHELIALTDCSFWEMNSLKDVQKDSVRVEDSI